MKRFLLSLVIILLYAGFASAQAENTALLVIDIQDFYFPGGQSALSGPEKAAANAALLLEKFRKEKRPVIHVRHNAQSGADINKLVLPLPGEKIISKDEVNCFVNTDLSEYLKARDIKSIVICGMQTHMCVEAATRAASDLGYTCTLIHDACATRDLSFGGKQISAADVHASTLATLRNYAAIFSTNEYLQK